MVEPLEVHTVQLGTDPTDPSAIITIDVEPLLGANCAYNSSDFVYIDGTTTPSAGEEIVAISSNVNDRILTINTLTKIAAPGVRTLLLKTCIPTCSYKP